MSLALLIGSFEESDKLDALELEFQKLELKYQTMENDRDAEKAMKATARMQRDKMSKRYKDLVGLLESAGVLQYDEEWAVEIQAYIKDNK